MKSIINSKHNNHEKHHHEHAHIRTQVFLVETLSGENHPADVVLLNSFINLLIFFTRINLPISQKNQLPSQYVGTY